MVKINEIQNQDKCLFDKGTRCYALKKKECNKCKFYIKNTEENRIKYIEKVNEDIKKYAKEHI